MFCSRCGTNNADTSVSCVQCGESLRPVAPMPGSVTGQPVATHVSNHLVPAILVTVFCCLPAGIAAIVFAAQVNGKLQRGDLAGARRSSQNAKTWCLVSLGFGIFWILFCAAIAIPNLLRARIAANEASAAGSVRTLVTAEISYSESHPTAGYTCKLSDLSEAQLIDSTLASGLKSGYTFEVQGCAADVQDGPNVKYQVVAYPVKANNTGIRAFCSDGSGVVKVDASGSPQQCLENGGTFSQEN